MQFLSNLKNSQSNVRRLECAFVDKEVSASTEHLVEHTALFLLSTKKPKEVYDDQEI